MWKPPECTVSGGFFLLLGWFAVSCGWQPALLVLSAASLHELGHALLLRRFHIRVKRLRISALGAVMELRGNLSYGQELAAALAGPLANLLAAAALGVLGFSAAAGANAVLCLFNLLPIRPLDGGQALYFLLAWAFGPQTAEHVCRCVGTTAALLVHAGAVWLVRRTGGSLWLLAAAWGLIRAAIQNR